MKTPNLSFSRIISVGLCSLFTFLAFNAGAIVYYWDPNGTTSIGGSGTWSTNGTLQWSSSSTQVASGSLLAWPASGQLGGTNVAACFCAGPTGSANQGTFTITVPTAINCAGIFNGQLNPGPCTLTLSGPGSINFITGNDAVDIFNNTTTINVPITGPGVLTAESSGTFALNATNTYTGGTLLGITGGSFTGIAEFNNSASFGTGTITVSNTSTLICALVAEGTSAITIANALSFKQGAVNIVGNTAGITFTGNMAATTNATIGSGGATNNLVTFSGVISGVGGLNKFNPGILRLSGANTYTGLTTVSNGILQLGVAGGIPSGSGKSNVVLSGIGTLDVHGLSASMNGLSSVSAAAGNGIIDNSTGTGTLTIGNNAQTSEYDGIIQNSVGTLNITKAGAGTLTLTGANTYSGSTTVSVGTLALASSTALPPSSPVSVAVGATLDLVGNSENFVTLNGGGSLANVGGQITISNNLSTSNTLTTYSACSLTIPNGNITKDGSSAMSFRGTYNVPGATTFINNGTFSVGAAPNRLPVDDVLELNNPTALFQLDANNQTLAYVVGTGVINLGGGQLTLTGPGNSVSAVIQDSELPGASTAVGHGLRGFYYTNQDFTGLMVVRDDTNVNFTDFTSAAQLPAAIYPKTNNNSVRWLGQVQSTAAGLYTFTTTSDDGVRLWVNGALVIDSWVTQSGTARSGTVTLPTANTRYDIVLEYFNQTGGASARLFWTPPGDTSSIIPTDYLYLPTPGQLVLSGSATLTLSGSNTYVGGTIINNGTFLSASGSGSELGAGNVIVSNGGSLQLFGPSSIGSNADLLLTSASGSVDIEYISSTNAIHALSLDGGVTYQPAGTYGNFSSPATFQLSQFTGGGNGVILVTAGPSTNLLTISSGAVTYGASITLTSTITGGGATPTGTVTFYDGASAIGTATLSGGVATFVVSDLQAITSPHLLSAVYGGDATHATSASAAVSQVVNPLAITWSGVATISNKVYDTTTTATLAAALPTLVGALTNDTNNVHLIGTATFADKTVANGKTVTITGVALGGSLAGNYTVTPTSGTGTANITQKALTITGITAANKTFDGTTAATINTAAEVATGVLAGDTITTNLTGAVGNFATAAVGNAKTVTITNITFAGPDGANYIGTQTTTANITKANSTSMLVSSANPSAPGASVTFTATVTGPGGTPSGNVIFQTNGVTLSTVALATGVASTSTTNLPVGTNTVSALYAGDASYVGITNSISQVVVVNSHPTLNIVEQGTNVVLTWTGVFTLQTSSNVTTNWSDIPSATSPYTNLIITTGNQFFRLRQ